MRKILIIEDELVVRSIYRRKFEMSGYQVETAEEGSAALKMLPTFRPDVIQVDIMMPGMDGVEVIKQIRAWPEFRLVPILVLSSFYRPDLAKEAWKAGASKCVSKMDCTPNLALDLVEQLLSGEKTGFTPKFGIIPLPKGILEAAPMAPAPAQAPAPKPAPPDLPKLTLKLDLPPPKSAGPPPVPASAPKEEPPPWPEDRAVASQPAQEPPPWQEERSTAFLPKIKGDLNLPPSKGAAPSRPAFALEKEGRIPAGTGAAAAAAAASAAVAAAATAAAPPPAPAAPVMPSAPSEPAKPAFFGKTAPAPYKPPTKPAFGSPLAKPAAPEDPRMPSLGVPAPKPAAPETPRVPAFGLPGLKPAPPPEPPPVPVEPEPEAPSASEEEPVEQAEMTSTSGPDFRVEIRHDFLKRVPLIQSELRERTAALMRSKSPNEQVKLLQELEVAVSSLAGLAGITGFSRVAHLSGALDALIKDLRKKPQQMTASVFRSIAHAMDCMNVLFRDLNQMPQEIPTSMLILAVDDEPISRRTLTVALGKANLRCISMEDSKMALTVLKENAFDLIFLDAEMPGMNGFELCTELRKLPTNKTTPVIFVTSMTKFETRAQSSLSGGSDLIAKPFLMMELAVKALTYLLKPPLSVDAKIRAPQTGK